MESKFPTKNLFEYKNRNFNEQATNTHIYIVWSKHYVIEIPRLCITRKNEGTGSSHGWQKIEDLQDLSQKNPLTFCFWKCALSASKGAKNAIKLVINKCILFKGKDRASSPNSYEKAPAAVAEFARYTIQF